MNAEPILLCVVRWKRHGAYHVAYLGRIAVGDVSPWGGRNGMTATWRMRLPDTPAAARPARDIPTAKAIVEERIAQWVDAAGLAPATRGDAPIRASVGGILAQPEDMALAQKYEAER